MPRTPQTWGGAAALWVTVAGWIGAEERRGGTPAGVLTPAGVIDVDECLAATNAALATASSVSSVGRRLPPSVRQAVRDGQRAVGMLRYSRGAPDLVAAGGSPSGYVWQHHELFHSAGGSVAQSVDLPRIEYVHAPIVWEARRWGVRRWGTGSILEQFGERPQLRSADLVACVSEEVRQEVTRFGVDEDRTIVAPMGVDAGRFSPDVDGSVWRERVRSVGDFVVVWTGSLRRFHHLDVALNALHRLRDNGCAAGMVIAGDGQDRERLTQVAADLGVSTWVDFVGQISTLDMPSLLSCGDAAVVTAGADQAFHYSPLKLREYLAMALPVVAADVGEIGRVLEDGHSGLLYQPGDAAGLASGLRRLADDAELRAHVGDAGRQRVLESWTWDEITKRCLERLPR